MQFREWLRGRENKDAKVLARDILRDHPDWALQLVAERIESVRRSDVHALERRVANTVKLSVARIGSSTARNTKLTQDHLAALLQRSFRLGNGVSVRWGDATVDQHEKRIAMLSRQRDGIENSVRLHQDAVNRLRKSGAACLFELAQQPNAA